MKTPLQVSDPICPRPHPNPNTNPTLTITIILPCPLGLCILWYRHAKAEVTRHTAKSPNTALRRNTNMAGVPVRLSCLGFCGADDTVDPAALMRISEQHGWVEWGVLFRPEKSGSPRFASDEWLKRLGQVNSAGRMRLAGHLCATHVDELLRGGTSFVRKLYDVPPPSRPYPSHHGCTPRLPMPMPPRLPMPSCPYPCPSHRHPAPPSPAASSPAWRGKCTYP